MAIKFYFYWPLDSFSGLIDAYVRDPITRKIVTIFHFINKSIEIQQ